MLNKKAAMFGLDARIALAIFGALSVISGAALYSAIQTAKNTQYLATLSEITKSFEAYLLDTGTIPAFHTSNILDAGELVSSSKSGWQGPYTSIKLADFGATCTDCGLDGSQFPHDGFSTIVFSAQKEDSAPASGLTSCTSGDDCMVWVVFIYTSLAQAQAWDEFIDGELNAKTGKFRFRVSSDPVKYYTYFQTGISLNI
tara:strand:+ start:1178 stop:1777 length:600 start_codon:yes stop_codon:yes gene_type:complete